MLTPLGTVTYSRGAGDSDPHAGTIDLIFAGAALAARSHTPRVVREVPGSERDHRVILTRFDVVPTCEMPLHFRRELTPAEESRVRDKCFEMFRDFEKPQLDSKEAINEFVALIHRALRIVAATIPIAGLSSSNKTDHYSAPEVAVPSAMADHAREKLDESEGSDREKLREDFSCWDKTREAEVRKVNKRASSAIRYANIFRTAQASYF